MTTTVFISYAASDSDWPKEVVAQLGSDLEAAGARVLLDQFHQQRVTPWRKLSIDEWREWMRTALKDAQHIICLGSPRYLKASERDLGDPWGYGVAFESLRFIHQLYQQKGRNDGRFLVVTSQGRGREDSVPEDLRIDCPIYDWSTERADIIRHASGDPAARRPKKETGETLPAPSPVKPALDHASATIKHLEAEKPFFEKVLKDLAAEGFNQAWAKAEVVAAEFVQGLASAEPVDAEEVMLSVQRVVKATGSKAPRHAASALYVQCLLRWTAPQLPTVTSKVILVPFVRDHAVTLMSAMLFGGEVALEDKGGDPVPSHTYRVRAAAGESRSICLLRAIFGEVMRGWPAAQIEVLKDNDDEADLAFLVARIQRRIKTIRRVDKAAFTLIIEEPQVYENAKWSEDLHEKAFSSDTRISEQLFGVSEHDIECAINEIWQQMAHPAIPSGARSPAAPLEQRSPMNTTQSITINSAGYVNLTTGNNAPATTQVTQIAQAARLDELQPLLQELRQAIDELQGTKSQKVLREQTEAIEQAIQTKPSDAKSRITTALEKVKLVAEAAEGAESVVDKVMRLAAMAAPILALLA